MLNEDERYDRQIRVEGWKQEKLKAATVAVIGGGPLATYTAIPLAALGIGNLRIISNAAATTGMILDQIVQGEKVHPLESVMKKINPRIQTIGIPARMVNEGSTYFLQQTDVIIDTTNDPISKAITLDYAITKGIHYFSTACTPDYGKILRAQSLDPRLLLHEFMGKKQHDLTSIVLGGMITEEVKRVLMEEEQLKIPLYYNLTHKDRFTYEQNGERTVRTYKDKRVLMIGAGALGNFAGLGLALIGANIDIMDADEVQGHNLNRQILYHDCVGENKARSLARKLAKIGIGETRAIPEYFTEETTLTQKYYAIFDCLDSFKWRAVVNDYAVRTQTPLISGGTNYHSGQICIYVPGKTSCLECQLGIHRLAQESEERQRQAGCIYQPNPSVIMSNQIIGGMMANEAVEMFEERPINGVIKYDAKLESKVGVNHLQKVCECK